MMNYDERRSIGESKIHPTPRQVAMLQCPRCECIQPLERIVCANCWSSELASVNIDGSGIVYAHTTLHRSVSGEIFAEPRHMAVIELDYPTTPRVIARVASALRRGDPVNVYQSVEDEHVTYTAELGET